MPDTRPSPSAALTPQDIAAVLDWWRLAGVDCAYRDAAEGWLQDEKPAQGRAADKEDGAQIRQAATATGQEARQIGGTRENWPADLETFRHWWLTEASLAERGAFPRVAPTGEAGAEIMLLLPMPEEADRDELLSGPDGQMARLILRAMGVAPASAYFATVLPRHTPLPDWKALAARGIGDIVRHHIGLVQPRRVLVLGRSISTLFTKEDAVYCAPDLSELRRSARRRERFWQSWLDWTGNEG